jgi:predicted transcriptional regulator
MSNLLEDPVNLKLSELLCEGTGVEVNVSELSRILNKHRNTIDDRISKLLSSNIVDPPFCHFTHLLDAFPLMVIEKADYPRDTLTNHFIETDPYIEAAYFVKDEEYNTLLIEYHRDLYEYQNWKEWVKVEGKVTPSETRQPSEALFLSTRSIIKYETFSPIELIQDNFKKQKISHINNIPIDEHFLHILNALLRGEGLRINESVLARKLGLHRKTVKRRIDQLTDAKIISKPVCRFPAIWTPPEHFQVISLVEIKRRKETVVRALMRDPHVTVMIKTNTGRFNMVLFCAFYKMADHLAWQEEYDQRFPGCLGAVRNTYLSPAMKFSITQQYIYLLYIRTELQELRGESILEIMKGTQ